MGFNKANERNYSDFYKRGDIEKCYKFRGFLSTIKEPKTKVSKIYTIYCKWCKDTGVISVSHQVFLNVLRERFRIETKNRRNFINAEYRYDRNVVPFNKKQNEAKAQPTQQVPEIIAEQDVEEKDLFDKIMDGEVEVEFNKEEIPEPVQEIETNVEEDITEFIEKEIKSDMEIEDNIKLEQINVVESFEKIEKIKYERRMKKLADLKESLLDRELNSAQLMSLIQKILAE